MLSLRRQRFHSALASLLWELLCWHHLTVRWPSSRPWLQRFYHPLSLFHSLCRLETRSRTSGGTQPTEGRTAHGRHLAAKQSEFMQLGQELRPPGAGHTIVLSFSSTYWNRWFTVWLSEEDKRLALSKQGQTRWLWSRLDVEQSD